MSTDTRPALPEHVKAIVGEIVKDVLDNCDPMDDLFREVAFRAYAAGQDRSAAALPEHCTARAFEAGAVATMRALERIDAHARENVFDELRWLDRGAWHKQVRRELEALRVIRTDEEIGDEDTGDNNGR